jgi:dTDP-4-dehydrorhamnose 3,5-epimerase
MSQKDVKNVNLDDVVVTSLNRIPTVGGDVLHALKLSDNGFIGFGEVYFSWINNGAIKAWKCHQLMTLNLVVPIGEVHFVFHLLDQKGDFRVEVIGENRYVRLTVPPGIWFGFQGIASGSSLLVNVADMEHKPDEVIRKSVPEFAYDWSKS